MNDKRFKIEKENDGSIWVVDTTYMYRSLKMFDFLFGNEVCYMLNHFNEIHKELLSRFECKECSLCKNNYCLYKHSDITNLKPCEAFELKEEYL